MNGFTNTPRSESTIASDAPRTSRTPTRRRHDLWLLALATLVTVALYGEMALRLNDMLPALPVVPFNLGELLFAAANGIGLLGTLVLALTAPPAATDEASATDAVAVGRDDVDTPHSDRPAAPRRPLRPVLTDA